MSYYHHVISSIFEDITPITVIHYDFYVQRLIVYGKKAT
jgi:hypothetical protein